jgi:hypothetical protein
MNVSASSWSLSPDRRAMTPTTSRISGRSGWKDWNVARYARDGDFVLVTNNASDFRQLYAREPLHAGLVIMIPTVGRVLQQRLFAATLDEIAILGEPVNRVLEVDLDGDDVTFALYDLPPTAPRA